ncbi:lipocalin family protein [Streptomyces sp. NPDC088766]|uniref:lipocalin family protein n=1 Tax=Streptomyces sp. NPDC088766 TaxID=3365893 RepID=UPI0037FD18E2
MPVRRPARRAAVVLACSALSLTATATATATAAPASVDRQVDAVDLTRYAGAWYQVAAVPQLFEIQCKKNVKALYTPQADGSVGVRNTCTTWWGSTSAVNGGARPLDASNTRLNVSFVPRPGGGFLNGKDANYVIVGLAADYTWAAVTNDDRSAGFLLSRTPALGAADTAAAVQAFTAAGADACELRLTRQDGGVQRPEPLC